jgi:cysteine synthase/rhodanese-related sulfurtransferase
MMGLLSSEDNPTPLVRLNKVTPYQHTTVYAKLEWYNPFGAVKDRVAENLIRDAEQRGVLSPGKRLVEATSGNTGIGLIMMGNLLGYPLRTPLSDQIPLEKRTVLRFLGAEVEELDDSLCPAPGAPEGAIAKARATAELDEFEILDQYMNEANPGAHYKTTGPEIWRQTEGKITHFVAGLGTCGTITGTGRFLKEKNPQIQVLGSVPEEGHDIPGVRSHRQLQQTKLYHPEEYDGEAEIKDKEAYDLCLRLNREEAIIAGPSSGMNLMAAFKLVPDEPGNVVVVIFCDNIFKYASSVVRHFPELAPPSAAEASTGPSKNDQFVAELLENLKNPHDTIKVKDLDKLLKSEDRPMVLDIRIPRDYDEAHIPGAVNIPQDDLSNRLAELPEDRDAPIVTVCNIGKFSKHVTLLLKSKGYRNVRSAKGGLNEWVRKGLETS